jgi:hypothetical protein
MMLDIAEYLTLTITSLAVSIKCESYSTLAFVVLTDLLTSHVWTLINGCIIELHHSNIYVYDCNNITHVYGYLRKNFYMIVT